MSSLSARRRLLAPRGDARLAILFLAAGVSSPLPSVAVAVLTGRARSRSFMGVGACASGGVGSCVRVGAGASAPWSTGAAVMEMRDWSERQVFMMLSMEYCADSDGGLVGGDAKRAGWDRGRGVACAPPSQEKADGRSMLLGMTRRVFFVSVVVFRVFNGDGNSVLALGSDFQVRFGCGMWYVVVVVVVVVVATFGLFGWMRVRISQEAEVEWQRRREASE